MNITRFNPSTNGGLHLGHIYALLVNERFAHDRDGMFYVRFDDTSQAIIIEMENPSHVDAIVANQKKDIEWLGIEVDGWQRQSEIHEEIQIQLHTYNPYLFPDPHPHYLPVSIRLGSSWIPYPYTPYQTAERVLMDNMLGITHVIRGEDFLTEYALYRYFCDVFDVPVPQFIHIPRLTSVRGDISKTNGGYKISDMRNEGYTPDEIISLMEKACLNYPHNGWDISNLKTNPRINL